MEELRKFLRLLKRYRFTVIIVPLVSIIVTFFLVRNLPNVYLSQARISTGLVEDSQQPSMMLEAAAMQGQQVSQEFSSIVEMMRMKKILDQVSYKLVIHDLTDKSPFRTYSSTFKKYSPAELKLLLAICQEKYDKSEELNHADKNQKALYEILLAMNYDSESIQDRLKINRAGDSDFINVEFESENPELSAFVANVVSSEFIKYYTILKKANQLKATQFLKDLLDKKKTELDISVDSLKNYKIQNRVLNLEEQSTQLYTQIIEYNNRKQEIIKSIAANAGAVSEIDRKFQPSERKYLESAMTRLNQRIVGTRQELQALYDQYVQSNFDEQYKVSIDSLQTILTSQINRSNDTYAVNPLSTKEALVQQKLNLEVQLNLARYSLNSIEKEIQSLNSQFDRLVPHEALVQSLERDVEVNSREYLDILAKYNASSMMSGLSIKLSLIQNAMPGIAQPSKKMLLVLLSGIISFIFCLIVLFVLYFTDNSVNSPRELANRTQMAVLGELKQMNGPDLDLNDIWENSSRNPGAYHFKEQLRTLRFEVESGLMGKIISICSITPSEGKTLLALSLSYAFKMTNKKVLLIDGNFSNPGITNASSGSLYLEDYFSGTKDLDNGQPGKPVTVLGNRGGDSSVREIADERTINSRLAKLKEMFDLIIIETPSLDKSNQAKEWNSYADSIITIFEAGKNLSESRTSYIDYFRSFNGKFLGWVINKAPSDFKDNSNGRILTK